ncbi:MAG: dienelactone hydrolase family protein [Bryobacteraceae bacterium]
MRTLLAAILLGNSRKTECGAKPFPPRTMVRAAPVVLLAASLALAQPLPNTQPLVISGDPAAQMVDGISTYLNRATAESAVHRHPTRERLAEILGVVDPRVNFSALSLDATTAAPALLARTKTYSIYRVRWPAMEGVHAEGLLYRPAGAPIARVVAIDDADQPPEHSAIAARLASQGCQVLALAILNRDDTYSGNPEFRMTNQPHREFIYRMAFPVGRTIIGYEVEKILAAVDWFARQPAELPIAVWGYGAGGMLALDAAALDPRIGTAVVSGYFAPRNQLAAEPIFRNVWGLLRDFGDAELAALMTPRNLIVETRPGPRWDGPSRADPKRTGAAPGRLAPVCMEAQRALRAPPYVEGTASRRAPFCASSLDAVEQEAARARSLGAGITLAADALEPFLAAVHHRVRPRVRSVTQAQPVLPIPPERTRRQFEELVAYTQRLIRASAAQRNLYWANADMTTAAGWSRTAPAYRDRVWNDIIGRLPAATIPVNARSRHTYSAAKWDGYEITLDVFPDVFDYGVLLLPKGLKPGERRPVVVCQHGLEGRPQSMFNQPAGTTDFHYYQNIGNRLADLGFIVYLPQNPYIFGDRFRQLQRQANPLGLSLFSFILAQHGRLLEWLGAQSFVDASRIGFYGLSYGGKTAIRVPPLLDGYALSICSGDFNEWVVKLTSVADAWSYLFTGEWEMDEWNLANTANYAELARLMAPRPFMVERGHRDAVGVDEWVAYEYAKVRRFYDELGLPDRTRIEFFNGPHQIHGVGTLDFLERFLRWPESR